MGDSVAGRDCPCLGDTLQGCAHTQQRQPVLDPPCHPKTLPTVVRLSLPSLGLPVLCDAAWALARLQFQPTEAWMEDFEGACVHAVAQRVAAAAAAAGAGAAGGPRGGRGGRGRKGAGRGREGSGRGRGRGQGLVGLEGPLPGDVVRQLRLLYAAYGELQLAASEPLAGLMRRAVGEAEGVEGTGGAQGEAEEAAGRQDATAAAAGAAGGADGRGSGGADGVSRLGIVLQQGGRQGPVGGGGGGGGEGVGQGEQGQGQGQGDLQAKLADLLLGPI